MFNKVILIGRLGQNAEAKTAKNNRDYAVLNQVVHWHECPQGDHLHQHRGRRPERPVRFLGAVPNTAEEVAKLAKRLAQQGELDFCYEAGGCGYGIHRQLTALGHRCSVVAPSTIPRKPGERIKTDRRDSEKLAILHRSGDLTPVWVPDTTHEALRDLVRARVDASMHLMRARQQLLAFLLRHGRSYPTGKHWTQRHRSWLSCQTFHEHAHGIVFQDYLETVWTANRGEMP